MEMRRHLDPICKVVLNLALTSANVRRGFHRYMIQNCAHPAVLADIYVGNGKDITHEPRMDEATPSPWVHAGCSSRHATIAGEAADAQHGHPYPTSIRYEGEATMAIAYYDWIAPSRFTRPQQTAIIDLATDRRFTYQEFDGRIARLAWHLRAELKVASLATGLQVLANNTTDTLEVEFACGRLGAIFVPLNWRLSDFELRTIMADCSPTMLFHDASFTERSISLATECGIPHTYVWAVPIHPMK